MKFVAIPSALALAVPPPLHMLKRLPQIFTVAFVSVWTTPTLACQTMVCRVAITPAVSA